MGVVVFALGLSASRAEAGSLGPGGQYMFDNDAILTLGFESLSDGQAVNASWISWTTNGASLAATAVTAADWTASGTTSGTVTLPGALEGNQALQIAAGQSVGLALVDTTLFNTLLAKRVQVSFWGLSMGAEPELDIVYPSTDQAVGPNGFGHLVAVRTGRETSDGWAEYSTGAIDGSIFGNDGIGAIVLTARFATADGTYALDSFDLAPHAADRILDPQAYALIDAVEVEPVAGTAMPQTACTQANAATTCGPLGECTFGHCVDGSLIWGAVPAAADHRADLVNRWAFIAEHLGGDRKMASNAAGIFSTSAISTVSTATDAPGFWGGLNTLVNSTRDGHTGLGIAPSDGTGFFEALNQYGTYSAELDVCFGLAKNDLPGGTGAPAYAVFWIAPGSSLGGTYLNVASLGTLLTQVDGIAPDAWLDTVGARYREALPNDPASEPAGRALLLAQMLGKYASTATFSSCTSAGVCTTTTVQVGALLYAMKNGKSFDGVGVEHASEYTRECTGRFTESVSTWTNTDDEARYDVPVVETVGGITSVEFDGFEGEYGSAANPYPAWIGPMATALSGGQNLLFDARQGHGGAFFLGKYLTHNIRGTATPYFTFSVPRGAWDDIDPTWLFDPSLDTCTNENPNAPDLCGWTGGQIDESLLAAPMASTVKIAWVNGSDVSMSDIVPRNLLGAPNFRIFGPHPTSGAYGEVSDIPAYVAGWDVGRTQVFDMRFGSSFTTAVASTWGSGTGVPPDQVVLQNLSDVLGGTDTVLTAAKAWLNQ